VVIQDELAFAHGVRLAMILPENEQGDNPVTRLLDTAILKALEMATVGTNAVVKAK
jgi:hypothetical protein